MAAGQVNAAKGGDAAALRLPLLRSGGPKDGRAPWLAQAGARRAGEGAGEAGLFIDVHALATLSRNGRLQEIYLRYFPYGLY